MRLGLTRLETYVLTRTLVSVLAALAILGAVVMLIDFVEISRDVGARAEVNAGQIFGLTLLKSPAVLLVLMPFAFLFGTLGAFVSLNRKSELVAMRAAGVSAWRFIFPAAAVAAAIGVLTFSVLNPAAAALNNRFEQDRSDLTKDYAASEPKDIWLRQSGRGRTQIVIHARSRSPEPGVVLKDVSLFIYGVDKGGVLSFRRRIDAVDARLMQGEWRLSGVREAGAGETAQASASMSIPSSLDRCGGA